MINPKTMDRPNSAPGAQENNETPQPHAGIIAWVRAHLPWGKQAPANPAGSEEDKINRQIDRVVAAASAEEAAERAQVNELAQRLRKRGGIIECEDQGRTLKINLDQVKGSMSYESSSGDHRKVELRFTTSFLSQYLNPDPNGRGPNIDDLKTDVLDGGVQEVINAFSINDDGEEVQIPANDIKEDPEFYRLLSSLLGDLNRKYGKMLTKELAAQ